VIVRMPHIEVERRIAPKGDIQRLERIDQLKALLRGIDQRLARGERRIDRDRHDPAVDPPIRPFQQRLAPTGEDQTPRPAIARAHTTNPPEALDGSHHLRKRRPRDPELLPNFDLRRADPSTNRNEQVEPGRRQSITPQNLPTEPRSRKVSSLHIEKHSIHDAPKSTPHAIPKGVRKWPGSFGSERSGA